MSDSQGSHEQDILDSTASVLQALRSYWSKPLSAESLEEQFSQYWSSNLRGLISLPVDEVSDLAGYRSSVIQPLLEAFGGSFTRAPHVELKGISEGRGWISTTGYFSGIFSAPLYGIQPTGQQARIRYGEFLCVEEGRITETVLILDWVDFLFQAGQLSLPSGRFDFETVPGAAPLAEGVTASRTQDIVETMIFKGLRAYDGKSLESMGMRTYFHDDMQWYGPGAIGTCRGIEEFEDFHQRPFLRAFPDRVGGTHVARITEGAFVASTGFPSVRGTFCDNWFGVKAKDEPFTMRVMDWWQCDTEKISHNWVLIDIPDVLRQVGFEVFPWELK